ncbi:MAG TPA: sulfate adenylyltransferase, partial [Nitrososphaerales archaeon]|nr:sulfate adenylyltransferase [Nitrososphaerales archaeon]
MVSQPHGGKLVQVREHASPSAFDGFSKSQKIAVSRDMWNTVANLANGVFSPLDGFMEEDDYLSVIDQMRLTSDVPWTIPILLTTVDSIRAKPGEDLLLVNEGDAPVAVLEYSGSFEFSKKEYAMKVFGTEDEKHPGVARIYAGHNQAVSGRLKSVARANYGKFADSTLTPKETRILFAERGWKTVVAFQTRNAPHINHEYLQKSALALVVGLFVNPVLGKKKPGDFVDDVIFSAYRALIDNYYPKNAVVLSALNYYPKNAVVLSAL